MSKSKSTTTVLSASTSFRRANVPAPAIHAEKNHGKALTLAVGTEERGVSTGDDVEYPSERMPNTPGWGAPVTRIHQELAGTLAGNPVHVALPGQTVARPGSLT